MASRMTVEWLILEKNWYKNEKKIITYLDESSKNKILEFVFDDITPYPIKGATHRFDGLRRVFPII